MKYMMERRTWKRLQYYSRLGRGTASKLRCVAPARPLHQRATHVALLSTLTPLLLLAAITLTLLSRSQISLGLLSRLTADLHDRAAQDALTDRLRGLVGDAMASPQPLPGRPRLDGTPFAMRWAGQGWQVRVQDVEGLVDLSLIV
jgi:hypothetical protein